MPTMTNECTAVTTSAKWITKKRTMAETGVKPKPVAQTAAALIQVTTFANPVTKKMMMGGTGLALIAFLFIHLLGNLSLFAGSGGLNTYAQFLHTMPVVVWVFRFVIALMFILHVWYAIQVTIENRTARPVDYACRSYQKSTLISRSMIWTGLIVAGFLIYHLLHFTLQSLYPDTSAAVLRDSLGRPDVYRMVVLGFQNTLSSLFYLTGLLALAFHLSHGIHSALQTFGLATQRTLPIKIRAAFIIAGMLFFAYTSIPISIFVGAVK
ncbi:MAG: frdC [Firmicutes bacterium]|nr:frdC [Bacillota bacterium]